MIIMIIIIIIIIIITLSVKRLINNYCKHLTVFNKNITRFKVLEIHIYNQ